MEQIYFSQKEASLLRRALFNNLYFLITEVKDIDRAEISPYVESILIDKDIPKDELDVTVQINEVYFEIINNIDLDSAILNKLLVQDCEFFQFTLAEIEQIHSGLHHYLWETLEWHLTDMEEYPGDQELLLSNFPCLEIDFAANSLFEDFFVNQLNQGFFEDELEAGSQLQYYVRHFFPNDYAKNDEEYNNSLLDIRLLDKMSNNSNNLGLPS